MGEQSVGGGQAPEAGAWGRYLRWPLPLASIWLLAPVLGILIRLSIEPIAPHDYWWSLAMGRLFAHTGHLPSENHWLYTLPQHKAYVDQPWLAQWLMFEIYSIFGHVGTILTRTTIAALAWGGVVVVALTRCDDPRAVGGIALAVAAVSGPIFSVRTRIYAFLPYIIMLAVVLSVATGRWRRRWLFVLAPLTALWANLHGTFMLVPAFVGLIGGSVVAERWLEQRRIDWQEAATWAGAMVAVLAAAMVTPLGPRVYGYVFHLMFASPVTKSVTEWQPPNPQTALGVVVLVFITASTVVLVLRRRQLRLFEVVLFAATTVMVSGAQRQLFWWGSVMLMVLPRHLGAVLRLRPWWKSKTSPLQGAFHVVIAVVLLLAAVAIQPGLPLYRLAMRVTEGYARRSNPGRDVLFALNPTRIMAGLEAYGFPGGSFTTRQWVAMWSTCWGRTPRRRCRSSTSAWSSSPTKSGKNTSIFRRPTKAGRSWSPNTTSAP